MHATWRSHWDEDANGIKATTKCFTLKLSIPVSWKEQAWCFFVALNKTLSILTWKQKGRWIGSIHFCCALLNKGRQNMKQIHGGRKIDDRAKCISNLKPCTWKKINHMRQKAIRPISTQLAETLWKEPALSLNLAIAGSTVDHLFFYVSEKLRFGGKGLSIFFLASGNSCSSELVSLPLGFCRPTVHISSECSHDDDNQIARDLTNLTWWR